MHPYYYHSDFFCLICVFFDNDPISHVSYSPRFSSIYHYEMRAAYLLCFMCGKDMRLTKPILGLELDSALFAWKFHYRRDDVIATVVFPIADLLDDGINGEYEMNDADGNPVGTVSVNINFESGDGELNCTH